MAKTYVKEQSIKVYYPSTSLNTEAKRNFATHSDVSIEIMDPKRQMKP